MRQLSSLIREPRIPKSGTNTTYSLYKPFKGVRERLYAPGCFRREGERRNSPNSDRFRRFIDAVSSPGKGYLRSRCPWIAYPPFNVIQNPLFSVSLHNDKTYPS